MKRDNHHLIKAHPLTQKGTATLRTIIAAIVASSFTMIVLAGCASTKVTSHEQLVTEKLPRPAHIWVYDFAATPADVPEASALATHDAVKTQPPTPEHIAEGKKLGAEIASDLVEQIRAMGLPAEHGEAGTSPEINDIVIKGYLISYTPGSAAKRLTIGFGSGESELKVAAEGFQMTPEGLRKIGSGTTASGGGKTPGTAAGAAALIATGNPAGLIISSGAKIYGEESGRSTIEGRAQQTATEIADVLKKRFQQEGWIE